MSDDHGTSDSIAHGDNERRPETAGSSRTKPLARSLAVAVLLMLVAEGGARLFVSSSLGAFRSSSDPELLYDLEPGTHRSDGWLWKAEEIEVRINPDGCRGPTFERLPDGPSRLGILFGGDSMTFGYGVDSEEAYPAQTARLLGVASANPPITFNCGVPGYNLSQNVRNGELLVSSLRPDVFVLLVHPADLEAPVDFSALQPRTPLMKTITQASRGARFAHLLLTLLIDPDDQLSRGVLSESETRDALARLRALRERYDCELLIYVIGRVEHPEIDFRALLDEYDLPAIAVPELPRTSEYFLSDDEHWTPLGNRRVANALVPTLRGLLDSQPLDEQ